MKIGIDARIFKTGIGRYTRNLIKELAEVSSPEDSFVVFLRKDDIFDFQPPDERFTAVEADFAPYSFAEQLKFLKILVNQNLDLVHFTNFNVPVLYPRKFVVTIHDLIHQGHSTFGSSTRNYVYYMIKKFVYYFAIRWVALRAKNVIVPSIATKNDIVSYLKTNPNKIAVTYEGFDADVTDSSQDPDKLFVKLGITMPYVLYVATMYPHKNHRTLINAIQLLRRKGSTLQLVLAGKVDHFSEQLKDEYEQLVQEGVIRFVNFEYENGYIPDDDLAVLYKHAEVYAFPSLKEGFGIPILEAQSYSVPVVSSNISCLPEIGGDSVYYVDPLSAQSIADGLERVLSDKTLQQTLIDLGHNNVKRFSWDSMTQQTYNVYKHTT